MLGEEAYKERYLNLPAPGPGRAGDGGRGRREENVIECFGRLEKRKNIK